MILRRRKPQPKKLRTRARFVLPFLAMTFVVVAVAARARRQRADASRPADVGFMRAMHDAFRRDLKRLDEVAPTVDASHDVPTTVEAGWTTLRDALTTHHAAEDEDLWPLLRSRLTQAGDIREVDAMVDEHRAIPAALDAVDAAFRSGYGVKEAAAELAELVLAHLDHEERTVLPLLEQHLSHAEWRDFLHHERDSQPVRARPEFLTWVLDEASTEDEDAVLTELPPPGRVVYRVILRRRYQAQHRWQPAA